MTVGEMLNQIEIIDNTIQDLKKIIDGERVQISLVNAHDDLEPWTTIENTVDILYDYKDVLLAKKIAP